MVILIWVSKALSIAPPFSLDRRLLTPRNELEESEGRLVVLAYQEEMVRIINDTTAAIRQHLG